MTTGVVLAERYRLHEQIGSGGMGVVWRATDELLGRQVAIKKVRLDLLAAEGATAEITRQRTLREARIAAQLHHPTIVTIFDVLTIDGNPTLVLEYLPSHSLAEVLGAHGAVSPTEAARIGVAIADALAVAHDVGIEHRDVKPGNVLIGQNGAVKLTDFGISHAIGDETLTRTNLLTGTVAYLAPEMARGDDAGTAADIYSLGATLYTAVEGTPAFGPDDNVFRVLAAVAAGKVSPPQRAGQLTPILHQLMDSDPGSRPTAAEARELLRAAAGQAPAQPRAISAADPTTDLPPDHSQGDPGSPPVGPDAGPTPEAVPAPATRAHWSGKRKVAVFVPLLAAAAALVAIAITALNGAGSNGQPAGAQVTASASVMYDPAAATDGPVPGQDPRTADPCSLVDPAPLAVYGNAVTEPDFGGFAECRATVSRPGNGWVRVSVSFLPRLEPNSSLRGTVEIRGDIAIAREETAGQSCERTILLSDRTRVSIDAELRNGASVDPCAAADTATATAVDKITTSGIGVRSAPTDPKSLALLDGCRLLDQPVITAAGLDATRIRPAYGRWGCAWGSNPSISVHAYRDDTVDDTDGERVSLLGRDALVLPGGYTKSADRCLVTVLHRPYLTSTGRQRLEVMQFIYTAADTPEELCRVAKELATVAIPKLPPL